MKGVIFNLLEKVVTDEFGPDTWDDLIDDAGVRGAYTSLGNYADQEVEALVAAAAAKTGRSRAEILRWFGLKAMPILSELYPNLFENHDSSEGFVLSVNDNIHPEVRKLYPDARCPFFHMQRRGDRAVTMRYESQRDLLDLAHGFIDGAAQIYGDSIAVEKTGAKESGDQGLDVRWVE